MKSFHNSQDFPIPLVLNNMFDTEVVRQSQTGICEFEGSLSYKASKKKKIQSQNTIKHNQKKKKRKLNTQEAQPGNIHA